MVHVYIDGKLYHISSEEHILLDIYASIFDEVYDKGNIEVYNSLLEKISKRKCVHVNEYFTVK